MKKEAEQTKKQRKHSATQEGAGAENITPVASIQELLLESEKADGNKDAFRWKDGDEVKSVTYKEFRAQTIALGTALNELGLGQSHVACIGENSYPWVLTYLTVLGSEGVFVPIDRQLPDQDVINVLNHSDASAVVFSGKAAELFRTRKADLPKVRFFISMDEEDDTEDFISFAHLLRRGKKLVAGGDDSYTKMHSDPNELKYLVYTSGTTGTPKGVMLTENNILSGVYYGLQVSRVYTRCLSVLPYHHTYEAVPGLLVALRRNVTICINDNLRNVLKNLQLFKPDYIYLVPAFVEVFYKRIWDTAAKSGKDKALKKLIAFSNSMRKVGVDMRKKLFRSITSAFGGELIKIVCGGAPIRPELGEFFDSIGISMTNGYGITECSPLVSVNRDDWNEYETAGFPLPCLDVRIENPDDEGNGELCVKGPVVMLGYYKMEEETKKVLVDGWFHTGDYGHLTEDNQIVLTGRIKNIIVLPNGKNVYPEEIENFIQNISYVKEVVVESYKKADDETKVGLKAEVYLDDEELKKLGVEDPIPRVKEDIAAACAELPPYKQISKIVIRKTEFEKTTSNKIKRNYAKS